MYKKNGAHCLAVVILLLVAAAFETESSPLSIWNEHLRFRREDSSESFLSGGSNKASSWVRRDADEIKILDDSDGSSHELTGPSRIRREDEDAQPMKNCSDELKRFCKSDLCPMDDSSLEKCCKCFQSCCSTESASKEQGGTAEPETEPDFSFEGGDTRLPMQNMTDSAKKAMNETGSNIKEKVKETASKVGGFFKNVGQDVKDGLGNVVDKVKSTTNDVKESARKGINQAAVWVKNKTSGGENMGFSSCMDGKNAKDSANCTAEEIITNGGQIMGNEDAGGSSSEMIESKAGKKTKRSLDPNDSKSNNNFNGTMMNGGDSSGETNVSNNPKNMTTKAPERKKSKRSPVEQSNSVTTESSGDVASTTVGSNRNKRGAEAADATTASSGDETTESAEEENGTQGQNNTVPIRAPGSVDPQEATLNRNKSSTGKVLSSEGGPSASGYAQGLTGSSSGYNGSNVLSRDTAKPGLCRPLNQGLKCIALGRDGAQCTDDSGCSGLKKCCFYACRPNADVGICEHPLLTLNQ